MQNDQNLTQDLETFEQSLADLLKSFGDDKSISTAPEQESLDAHVSPTVKLDVQLKGTHAGLQLAKSLAEQLNIPLIFLTTEGSTQQVAEASITIPQWYLNRSSRELIDPILHSLRSKQGFDYPQTVPTTTNKSPVLQNAIFVKENMHFVKVAFDDIDFVQSDGNYIKIHWANRISVLKRTIKSFEEKVAHRNFFQVHRSYLVNLDKISRIDTTHVYARNHKIPVSKGKKEQLLNLLDTFY